jgi:hypothetical protein
VKEEKIVIYCWFPSITREKKEDNLHHYLGQKRGEEVVAVVRFG